MKEPLKIIINADDLGISSEVNAAIFDLMDRRKITSATIMANGPAVEEAARLTSRFPHCSFGVHLNLTDFSPLTSSLDLEPILAGATAEQRRIFGPRNILASRARSDSSLRRAIFAEWGAQIGRVRSLGVSVSHLDSHHHTHTIPWLFGVLKKIQKRYGISKVRRSANVSPAFDSARPSLLRAQKAAWNFALRHWGRTNTTDAFTSFEAFRDLYAPVQHTKAARPWFDSVELMTHPGGLQFEIETQSLEDDWATAAPFPTRLVSYNDL